ncbi:MAG TPA: LUD domain-containing protein, partial [Longimicrobiales bacterium]|nr:LUD domain-containing protein [Longimicrobiales bacterium]
MSSTPSQFKAAASRALRDPELQSALGRMREGFIAKRSRAVDALPEYDALREAAREIKAGALRDLDALLERFEERVTAAGGQVHRCGSGEEAVEAVLRICGEARASSVVKSKSMTTEEIELNHHLEARGIDVVETDLGEYAVQLRNEPPSHILAPAIHLSADQVEEAFRARHRALDDGRALETPSDLVREARQVLRERFLDAEVGITGANFLVAETGTLALMENEGNIRL